MFFIFTPFSFLYLSIYVLLLFVLFTINNFFYFWSIIEILILLLIGVSYSLIVSSYSQLIVYFLLQSASSFLILSSFLYSFSYLLTFAFLLKLSMFPLFFWYLNVAYRLPNLVLWLTSTTHKLPPMLLMKVFSLPLNAPLLWASITLTLLVRGVLILSTLDLRILLVLSSIGNNAWLVMSQIVNFVVFMAYFLVYAISVYSILCLFGSLSNFTNSPSSPSHSLRAIVVTLSGMPPFPLFFLKVLILIRLVTEVGANFLFMLVIFRRSFMFMSYLSCVIKYFTYGYTVPLTTFISS